MNSHRMISTRTLNTFQDYIVANLSEREIERLFEDNGFRKTPFVVCKDKTALFKSYLTSFVVFSQNEKEQLTVFEEGIAKILKANNIVAYMDGHLGEKYKKEILEALKKDGYELVNDKLTKVDTPIDTIEVSPKTILLKNYANLKESDESSPEKKIGLAKDLLESLYKTLCDEANIQYEKGEYFDSLAKKALDNFELISVECSEKEKSSEYIKQIIKTVSLKINEIRNIHGYGHGKNKAYKPIDIETAKLIANLTISIATFFIPKLKH